MGKILCSYKSETSKSFASYRSPHEEPPDRVIQVRHSKTTHHYRENSVPTFVRFKHQPPHSEQIEFDPLTESMQMQTSLHRLTQKLLEDIDTLHYAKESTVQNIEELVQNLTSEIDPEVLYLKQNQILKPKKAADCTKRLGVYNCNRQSDGKPFLMKILEIPDQPEQHFVKVIYNEAGTLIKLDQIEKVVRVEQILVFGQLMYIIFEPMHCTLARLMVVMKQAMNEGFSQFEAAYIIHEILHGLHRLHQNHIIHRDLKPENILISKRFDIKISDFGPTCSLIKRRQQIQNFQEEDGIEVKEYTPFRQETKPVIYILVDLLSQEKRSIFSYRERDKQESFIHRVVLQNPKTMECKQFIEAGFEPNRPRDLLNMEFIYGKDFDGKNKEVVTNFKNRMIELMTTLIN